WEVGMRYVFKQPHDWSDELSVIVMLWSVFLGAALALREGKITYVDLVPLMLKPRPRTKLFIVMSITTIITCAAYAWSGGIVVETFFNRGSHSSSSLAIPYWIYYLILPVSLWLCTLFGIESLFKHIARLKAKDSD
ncbi:MAG: TRAP transporter small permease, partial [Syntrophaceae bacterium]|nr:TRAP transporter small permease [Syntrophaceae bacterium]